MFQGYLIVFNGGIYILQWYLRLQDVVIIDVKGRL